MTSDTRATAVLTALAAVCALLLIWSAAEFRAMRRDLDIRRLRLSEPIVTELHHPGGVTSITTPRIEGETTNDWTRRHADAVMLAIKVIPFLHNTPKVKTDDENGVVGR